MSFQLSFKVRKDGDPISVTGLYRRKYIGKTSKDPVEAEQDRKASDVITVDGFILGVYWDPKDQRPKEEMLAFEDKKVSVEGIYHSTTPPQKFSSKQNADEEEEVDVYAQTLQAPYIEVKSIKLAE
jgi:hypothetical protein